MLNIVSLPHCPVICIMMTSLEGKSNWFQLSVLISALMNVMTLVLLGALLCLVGYTGVQSLDVIVYPVPLIAGS
jgi:hypothetical protein